MNNIVIIIHINNVIVYVINIIIHIVINIIDSNTVNVHAAARRGVFADECGHQYEHA